MWKTVFDSVTGASHDTSGTPCQDACRVVTITSSSGEELLIIACADGAGSAKCAADGSMIACDEVVKYVQTLPHVSTWLTSVTRDDAVAWIGHVRSAIAGRAAELNEPVRQLATTLLVAVIGESASVFIHIGDGAIVVREDDDFRCMFWPQSGEYANTTNFVTDDDFADKIAYEVRDARIDECVVFTDGLERLILRFDNHTVHRPFIEPMLQNMRSAESTDHFFTPLREFLASARINERTDDDKTLILATRLSDNGTIR